MRTEVVGVDGARMKSVEQHTDEDAITQHAGQILHLTGLLGRGMFRGEDFTLNQPIGTLSPVVGHHYNIFVIATTTTTTIVIIIIQLLINIEKYRVYIQVI